MREILESGLYGHVLRWPENCFLESRRQSLELNQRPLPPLIQLWRVFKPKCAGFLASTSCFLQQLRPPVRSPDSAIQPKTRHLNQRLRQSLSCLRRRKVYYKPLISWSLSLETTKRDYMPQLERWDVVHYSPSMQTRSLTTAGSQQKKTCHSTRARRTMRTKSWLRVVRGCLLGKNMTLRRRNSVLEDNQVISVFACPKAPESLPGQ
ncbi:hypothetical protein DL98DRAFT_577613 [Cadophora sp. DSE1049]|nr:hypothetical protein DL98DRAFT_577613 [Cadophora sp. DSE1049]